MNDSREAIAILFHAFCLREWRVSNGSETGTADCDFNCNNAPSSALSHTTMLSSTYCCEDPEMGPIWCRIFALLGLCATHFSSFAIVRTEHPIQSAMNVELGPSDRSLPSKAMDADLPIEVRI